MLTQSHCGWCFLFGPSDGIYGMGIKILEPIYLEVFLFSRGISHVGNLCH